MILAELAENSGLTLDSIQVANARWADISGISKERPVRESIIMLRKPQ